MKKFISSMVLGLALFQSAAQATVESGRCAQAGDSLNEEQALARTAWAVKCYPEFTYQTTDGKVVLKDTATGAISTGYPIFAEVKGTVVVQFVQAPYDAAAPCWDTTRYRYVGFCRAGCFTPDQNILMVKDDSYQDISILTGYQTGLMDIISVDGSLAGSIQSLRQAKMASYVVDMEDQNQPILVITTAKGGQLKVTPNHPLVNGDGYMVAASTLSVGDALYYMWGEKAPIVSIEKVDYFGKVYNVDMGSTNVNDNIIVANSFLSGTVYFQNDGVSELNRLVLRGNLIPEEFLK